MTGPMTLPGRFSPRAYGRCSLKQSRASATYSQAISSQQAETGVHFFPTNVLNKLEFSLVGVGTGCALKNCHLPAVRLWCRGRCASASASCQRRTQLPTMIRGTECRGPARRMRALHVGDAL